jgi:hypothetical protein
MSRPDLVFVDFMPSYQTIPDLHCYIDSISKLM